MQRDEKNNNTLKTVYERLTPIFREVFDDETLQPHPLMTAAEVEKWDSLGNILIIIAIEEAFKISFSIGEITQFKNVGELVATIEKKI